MYLSQNEGHHFSLSKFESMLKTNDILFFDSDEFEAIIFHYLEVGKIALAKKAVRLGLEQHPNSIHLLLFKVEIFIFENKLEDADYILNNLHKIEPSNEEIYIQKANILSKKDKHLDAIKMLEIALENTTDAPDVYSLLAMEYMFLEDFENAKINYMKCLEIDQEDYSALYNIIYCFDVLEEKEASIKYLLSFIEINPYCEVAWHQIGKQYCNLKKYDEALDAFDYAIIADEFFIGAYLEKGKVLERLKRHKEAIQNYQITLELDDPTAFAYLRIGKCYEKLGVEDLAIHYYKKATHEDPLLDKAWIAITDFHCRKFNFQKALYYINKAIQIDEENILYWKRFSKINKKLNFLEEAEKGLQKSLELGNYELETWITRCDLLISLGEYETAIQTMNQAIEFYPEMAEIEYRLAGLHFSINQGVKGYAHLEKGLTLDQEYVLLMDYIFPNIFNRPSIQKLINKYKA
ncbi:tetratricopeptide repeat protein [Mesonia sp.]|uniref:tetratricopeptide repeat protein n=1 Tax=Mesonia sp. TaxID=1960830 RepID=UPI003F986FF0